MILLDATTIDIFICGNTQPNILEILKRKTIFTQQKYQQNTAL
jgi:hypothetical protein